MSKDLRVLIRINVLVFKISSILYHNVKIKKYNL